jgi:hypothetical protein
MSAAVMRTEMLWGLIRVCGERDLAVSAWLHLAPVNHIMPRLSGRGCDPVVGTGLMTIKFILLKPRLTEGRAGIV